MVQRLVAQITTRPCVCGVCVCRPCTYYKGFNQFGSTQFLDKRIFIATTWAILYKPTNFRTFGFKLWILLWKHSFDSIRIHWRLASTPQFLSFSCVVQVCRFGCCFFTVFLAGQRVAWFATSLPSCHLRWKLVVNPGRAYRQDTANSC